MKQHEREFFVTQIRSGYVLHKDLEIRPAKILDLLKSKLAYSKAYSEALEDGAMTEEELEAWMIDTGLWLPEDSKAMKQVEQDIQKFKLEIFKNFYQDDFRERIRKYLRVAENFWTKKAAEKQCYAYLTAEGIAKTEEALVSIRSRTYKDGKKYDFSDIDEAEVLEIYSSSILTERQVRELAKNTPWKSLWSIKDNIESLIITNNDTEPTENQMALIQWSQVYDNIQESVDCPPRELIEDDDALDGWFIDQDKKQQKHKSEKDFDDKVKSNKIKNASEVFVMARSDKEKERVDNMNSVHGKQIKKQRYETIKKHGSVGQEKFADEKLKLRTQATQKFKDSVRRR